MIYNAVGLMAYEARFERCEINGDLVSGFVTAIDQFGCELFPNNDLCNIVFSNTRMIIEPRDIDGTKVTFLVIAEISEDDGQIMQIINTLQEEVRANYLEAISGTVVNQSKLEPLNTFIVDLFKELGRTENPFACAID
jgi:hypothetical protein